MEQQLIIKSGSYSLAATLHRPNRLITTRNTKDPLERFPLIIICHGFIGSRIGVDRLFVKTARDFAQEGYFVLRFDYQGCGESAGDYGQSTLADLIEQTQVVIHYAMKLKDVDSKQITLIGHSLGGAVALLTAVKEPDVRTLVLWAPVAHPFKDLVNIIGPKTYLELKESGKADYLGYEFTNAFFESMNHYSLLQTAKEFTGDVLIVHGDADDVVPVEYCFLYQKTFWFRNYSQCDKEIIAGANHTFSNSAHWTSLQQVTKKWLKLKSQRIQEMHSHSRQI
jgi:uncharacterized protein